MKREIFETYMNMVVQRYREGKCTKEEIDTFVRFFQEQYDPELSLDDAAKFAGTTKGNLSVHISRKAMTNERPRQTKTIRLSALRRIFNK